MKNTFIALLLLTQIAMQAQSIGDFWNASMLEIAAPASRPGWVFIKEEVNLDPTTVLVDEADAFLLGVDDAMVTLSTETDELGLTHYKYQQEYDGVPVEYANLTVHANGEATKSVTGAYVVGLNLSTTPIITGSTAIATALAYVNATTYAWDDPDMEDNLKYILDDASATYYPVPELVITFDDEANIGIAADYVLVYKVLVFAIDPHLQQQVYVDAINNTVVRVAQHDLNCSPTSGETLYNGIQPINTRMVGTNEYILWDDCNNPNGLVTANVLQSGMWGGYIDTDNDWTDNDVPTEAVAAHWALMQFYDYLSTAHGRDGYNNQNSRMAQVTGGPWTRFYPTSATTGFVFLGQSVADPSKYFVTLDIVGHEWGHGVAYSSAGLIGNQEAITINEAFADIFGTLNEFHALGSTNADWVIGAETGLSGTRDLQNPHNSLQPKTYINDPYWDAAYADEHINAGVISYWFYLLSNGGSGTNGYSNSYTVATIGMQDAAAIMYRGITRYLHNTSTFIDTRDATILAAIDLFGACSFEVEETINAWDAVGVPVGALTSGTAPTTETVCGTFNINTFPTVYAATNLVETCSTGLVIEVDAPPIELVSGVEIVLGPGTWIKEVDFFHAHIANICPPQKNSPYQDATTNNTSQEPTSPPQIADVPKVSFYPNPFNELTTFDITVTENETNMAIAVTDMYGKQVMIVAPNQQLNKGIYTYQLLGNNLTAGAYFAEIVIGNHKYTERLVKVN